MCVCVERERRAVTTQCPQYAWSYRPRHSCSVRNQRGWCQCVRTAVFVQIAVDLASTYVRVGQHDRRKTPDEVYDRVDVLSVVSLTTKLLSYSLEIFVVVSQLLY